MVRIVEGYAGDFMRIARGYLFLGILLLVSLFVPAMAQQDSTSSPFGAEKKAAEGSAYIFLFDVSKSLSPKQFEQTKKGLSAWIEILEEHDRIAILTFGNEVNVLQDFTASRGLLQSALDRLVLKASTTRLHAALLRSLELARKDDADLPGKRVIILLSDGVDDFTGAMNREEVLQRVKKAQVPLFIVGFFNPPATPEKEQALVALKQFAEASGGHYERADERNFDDIYIEIRRKIRALKPAATKTNDPATPVPTGDMPVAAKPLDALMPRSVADNDIARVLWLMAMILALAAAGWVSLRYLSAAFAARGDTVSAKPVPATAKTLPRAPPLAFIEYAGGILEITTSPCTVGAVRDNDLVINHDSVSRYHATIEFRDGKFHITDRDATNGTRVGGKEVKQAELVEGSRVCFGSWEGVFHVGDPANLAKQRVHRRALETRHFAQWAASALVVLVLVSLGYLGYRQVFSKAAGSVLVDRLSVGGSGPEMVVIPSGRFFMGNRSRSPVGNPNELPVHEVEVKSFALGLREVSFSEFDRFCDATGRPRPDDNRLGRGLNPVINVSWNEAVAYTEWLSEQTGQRYRLPTEAEWEYAARAGTGTEFSWGNEPSREYANYGKDDCCEGFAQGADRWVWPSPVASFPANPFGLFDMAGNVYEWTCSNYHEPYSGQEQVCAKPQDDLPKVFRGGSWFTSWKYMRPATRLPTKPDDKHNYLGFRVARDL